MKTTDVILLSENRKQNLYTHTDTEHSPPIFVIVLSAKLRDTNYYQKRKKKQIKSKTQFAFQWSLYMKHVCVIRNRLT